MKTEVLIELDGMRIRRIRERLRLSQEDFARRLNVSRRTIIRWEADDVAPSKMFQILLKDMQ